MIESENLRSDQQNSSSLNNIEENSQKTNEQSFMDLWGETKDPPLYDLTRIPKLKEITTEASQIW